MSAQPQLCALLGPTNTGKTHFAIERMLEHDSGVFGLPLRLLAREVYDRVSTRVGEQAVALVTGEEKRVPTRARYWICTTEAMPRDLRAEFVAVDEVQLMGHPERGHVFTDRVLHARGRSETWFLGAGTAEGLLRRLLPGLQVTKLPRLSKLSHLGPCSLRTLPRRSAVVAFNVGDVYAIADALRRRRGGAAVVLGALSPRVRNAQVALYQAGEVDFLVATDAIGMGLNLDIDHVALAGTVKFDGFETRELDVTELAQIAGRAGRHLKDGTFGTLNPQPELPAGVVQALEQHRFPALRQAYYRNAALDFGSLTALLSSLARRPPDPNLRPAPEGDDMETLRALARHREVADDAGNEHALRALWDVCRIPNYEKRLPQHQAEAVYPLYVQLAREGRISHAYVEERVRRLEQFDGDMHVLIDRLAAVRTWSYVSHQAGWLEEPLTLQQRTRALEDKLSDALHERLLARFVEPGAKNRGRRGATGPFASLSSLSSSLSEEQERERWVERLIAAEFAQLTLSARGGLSFEGEAVATLVRGQALLRPGLKLRLPDWVERGASVRIERRLTAHVRDLLAELLSPLSLDRDASAPLRGLAYQLEQGLGTVDKREAAIQVHALGNAERAELDMRAIMIGRRTVCLLSAFDDLPRLIRVALVRVWVERDDPLCVVEPDSLLLPLPAGIDRSLSLALGFWPLRSWLLRCDVMETLLALEVGAAQAKLERELGLTPTVAEEVARELPRGKRRRRR